MASMLLFLLCACSFSGAMSIAPKRRSREGHSKFRVQETKGHGESPRQEENSLYHRHHLEVLNSDLTTEEDGKNKTQMMEVILREEMWNGSYVSPLRLQRQHMKVVASQQEGFVRVRTLRGKDATRFVVEVATPQTIVYVFLLMYGPLLLCWAYYFQSGRQEKLYTLLLPITLCLTLVGDNFVQKSLAILMQSPMAITSAQAASMGVVASVWCLIERKPMDMQQVWMPLIMWGMVAIMFTTYQLLNHLVAYYCSLAERTVFTNLCPVVSLMFEATVMPKNLRASVSFRSKLALGMLVLGAITFSIQYPDFTVMGIIWASLMVVAVVPYRLAQRYTLNEAKLLPVMLLVAYDGYFLCTPSTAIAAAETRHYLQTWEGWMSDSSIPLLLVLSMCTFIANHACALLVLQMNSATALQVYQNLSNFVVVALGILFYGDDVLNSPLTLLGLIVCLFSGLWYAVEVQPKSAPEKAVEGSKDDMTKSIKA